MRNDIITLVTLIKTFDDDGFNVSERHTVDMFADKKSIKRNEFYEAMRTGLKPVCTFDVDLYDFESAYVVSDGKTLKPERVIFGTDELKITRTYQTGETVEIVCEV